MSSLVGETVTVVCLIWMENRAGQPGSRELESLEKGKREWRSKVI